jgi:hypothetical protein
MQYCPSFLSHEPKRGLMSNEETADIAPVRG